MSSPEHYYLPQWPNLEKKKVFRLTPENKDRPLIVDPLPPDNVPLIEYDADSNIIAVWPPNESDPYKCLWINQHEQIILPPRDEINIEDTFKLYEVAGITTQDVKAIIKFFKNKKRRPTEIERAA